MSAADFLWSVLAIALCAYGGARLGADAARRLRRRRRSPEHQPQDCRLRYRLGGVTLDYNFASPVERQAFNEGFREGMEQQVMFLQRAGVLGPDSFLDFEPLDGPPARGSPP